MPLPVAVLLASFNGEHYIGDQLTSIVNQQNVYSHVYISDDLSSDGTLSQVADIQRVCPGRISLIHGCKPPELAERNSANNFYYLIVNFEPPPEIRWVAFSDQDDIWHPLHLSRAIGKLCNLELSGYSSSVLAFWSDGRQRLVEKSGFITEYNHLFEAPGPGCSFVLPRDSFDKVKAHIKANLNAAALVHFHDWAIYAILRDGGGKWMIDSWPSLLYRQHESNVLGVQLNRRAIIKRLRMLFGGWYRQQCLAISSLVGASTSGPGLLLSRFSLLDRIKLALLVAFHRRRLRDRLILPFAFLLMSSIPHDMPAD